MNTDNENICGSTNCIANINGRCVAEECQGVFDKGKGVIICFDTPSRLAPEDAAAIYEIGMRHLKENLNEQ